MTIAASLVTRYVGGTGFYAMKTSQLILLFALAGCTTDKVMEPDTPSPREVARVRVVDTVPDKVGRFSNLSAVICRGGSLGSPSREAALQLLRTRAYMNGYLTIHSVQVGPVDPSLAKDCPGGIQARGIGYSLPK